MRSLTNRMSGVGRFVLGLALLLMAAIASTVTSRAEQPIATGWGGAFSLDVSQAEVAAGDEFDVTVFAEARDGAIAELAIFGTLNSTLLSEPVVDGAAAFTISEVHTRHRGMIAFVATIEGKATDPVNVMVLPQPAVEPVVPLVGPRTIIADGVDITMVAVSPADQFGNAPIDDTEVATTLSRTDGAVEPRTDLVDGGIAAIIVTGTTETGRVTVSSTVGDAGGPGNVFDQVAGAPADFAVEIDPRNAVADGFNLRDIMTTVLRDQFDNILPDGIGVVFEITSEDGLTFAHATVQGGVARTRIQAPASAGTISVRALISGAVSETTSLIFDAAVDALPVEVSTGDEWHTVTVGPVLSQLGGYVPDGTVASIYDDTGQLLATAEIRGGSVAVLVPETPGRIEVEVLGLRVEVPQTDSGSGS